MGFIDVKNLSHYFLDRDDDGNVIGEKIAIDDISLEVSLGDFICVLGHNGSGKSTFAKHLNAILLPTGGKIYVDGIDTEDKEKMWDIRQNTGMVFQNPDNQIISTVVEEDVAFGPENLGVETKEIWTRVEKALNSVNMIEYRKHSPNRLSGGQKQRVAIAGVMAMMPECIIFDESTAMLDPLGRKDVMEAIERLNRDKGITVIMITHYMDEAARADRVIVLDDGSLILDGTPSEVFEQEEMLRECGLAIPQCTELVHKLRAAGISLEGECVSLEDCALLIERSLKKQ
jgi:energy-coupling factor transporter ATPase